MQISIASSVEQFGKQAEKLNGSKKIQQRIKIVSLFRVKFNNLSGTKL